MMQPKTPATERATRHAMSAGVGRGFLRALVLGAVGSVAWLGFPEAAHAEGRVVTISEVTIVGRVQKPIAAVDVSRIQPHLTLAELRQSFSDSIEKALYRAPF